MITNRTSRKVKRADNRVNPLAIITNFLSMVNVVSWGYSLLEFTGSKLFQIYDVVTNPPLQITIRKRKRNTKQKSQFSRTRGKEDTPTHQPVTDSEEDEPSFVRKKKSKFLEHNQASSPDSQSPYKPSVSEEVKPPANEKILQLENELSRLRAEITKIAATGMPSLSKSSEPLDEQRQMHQMLNLAYYEESSYLLPLPPPPPPPITYPTSPTRYAPLPLPSDLPPPPMFGSSVDDSTVMMPPPPPPCDTDLPPPPSTSPLRATTTRVAAFTTTASSSPSVARAWQVQTDDMEYDVGSQILGKRSIQRSGKFDLTEILSRSGSLKKVDLDRSPGGTPVRSLEEQEADPSTMSSVDIIAHALRKKFQQINMSPESSPDSDKRRSFMKENDDSWFDMEDKENNPNRASLSSSKRPSLTPSKVPMRQSLQPTTCDTTL